MLKLVKNSLIQEKNVFAKLKTVEGKTLVYHSHDNFNLIGKSKKNLKLQAQKLLFKRGQKLIENQQIYLK